MPCVRELVKSFTKVNAVELPEGVNEDEAVALGAAVQGALLNKQLTGLVLQDVNPLSIGIEKIGVWRSNHGCGDQEK